MHVTQTVHIYDKHLAGADVLEVDHVLVPLPHPDHHESPQEGLAARQHRLVRPKLLTLHPKGHVAQLLRVVQVLEVDAEVEVEGGMEQNMVWGRRGSDEE